MTFTDPTRVAPMSFQEWAESFRIADDEDRLKVAQSARRYLKEPTMMRVLGLMERDALASMVNCDMKDVDTLQRYKALVEATKAFRQILVRLAADAEFEEKTAKDQ